MISLSLNDWLVNILCLISKYDLDDGEFLIAKLLVKLSLVIILSLILQFFKILIPNLLMYSLIKYLKIS